eukprot:GHVQ01014410.1.p1 GENE.GHVQ01014410.1~~GHVQ01014410.1.p1  ORF type:complete len:350 (+),score=39.13 GHVQ01014410.1:89-1138(+)
MLPSLPHLFVAPYSPLVSHISTICRPQSCLSSYLLSTERVGFLGSHSRPPITLIPFRLSRKRQPLLQSSRFLFFATCGHTQSMQTCISYRTDITAASHCVLPLPSSPPSACLHVLAEMPEIEEDESRGAAQSEPRVTAYFITPGYDLASMKRHMQSVGLQVVHKDNFLIAEGAHVFKQKGCTAIFFKNGCAVLWNMSRVNELKVQEIAKRSEKPWPKGCADSMFLEDSEELDVYDTSDNTMVSENGLHLTTSRLRLTDKVAASCALMTAVRLNVIEKKIERQLLLERSNIEKWRGRTMYYNLRSLAELLFSSMTMLQQLRYELNIEHGSAVFEAAKELRCATTYRSLKR